MTQTTDAPFSDLDTAAIDARIAFHTDSEVMEIDFAGLRLNTQTQVNAFYDRVEEAIDATGQDLWFFLINYSDSRIDPDAWFAHARRGKTLNIAHSMGSVRFDASEVTRRQIEHDAGTEAFDPNLFSDRDAAMARLKELPSKRIHKTTHTPNYTDDDFAARIEFLADAQIMQADFSNFTFHHSRDVDDFYDYIEQRIIQTDQKWYFLVNYNACQILPQAWIQYARRGKSLNIAASLGSVRYATGSETEAEIRGRAQSQEFRPNIRNTRALAMDRITEMKAQAQGQP